MPNQALDLLHYAVGMAEPEAALLASHHLLARGRWDHALDAVGMAAALAQRRPATADAAARTLAALTRARDALPRIVRSVMRNPVHGRLRRLLKSSLKQIEAGTPAFEARMLDAVMPATYLAMRETLRRFAKVRHRKSERWNYFARRFRTHYIRYGGSEKTLREAAGFLPDGMFQDKRQYKKGMREAKDYYHERPPALSAISRQVAAQLYTRRPDLKEKDRARIEGALTRAGVEGQDRAALTEYFLFGDQSQFALATLVRRKPQPRPD